MSLLVTFLLESYLDLSFILEMSHSQNSLPLATYQLSAGKILEILSWSIYIVRGGGVTYPTSLKEMSLCKVRGVNGGVIR